MALQDWEPTGTIEEGILTSHTHVYFDSVIDITPIPPTIPLKIRDCIDVPEYSDYLEFRLSALLYYGTTSVEWLVPTCYQMIGILNSPAVTPISENGLTYDFIPEFKNLNVLPDGDYQFIINFNLEGFLPPIPEVPERWDQISRFTHILEFHVSGRASIPIIYNPYIEGENAFTLDPKYFTLKSYNENTYFQFVATIQTFDFFTNTLNQYIIPQKAIPFNTTSKIALGKTIHQLMGKFDNPNSSFNQYDFAKLSVVCTEYNFADDTTVRSQTISNIPFIAGIGREIINLGFLDFNSKPNRVTTNSFAYLNFIVPAEGYEIRILRNNNLVNTLSFDGAAGRVFSKKIVFNNFTPGDVIDCVLTLSTALDNTGIKKTFILFPEGMYSNMIVWENEFLLQSAIECTGTAQLKSEVEFQSQKTYNLFVEALNHISTSKEVKLTINTGWILKQDIPTVESLMRTKRAWLVREEEIIELAPISKSLPTQDTETELIAFQIEFIINRNYDEETYTL